MPFTPPAYPDKLKRANWDSNKGLLAKAKGFTGMGEGLAALKAQYDKVDWSMFDLKAKWGTFNTYAQKGFTLAKLEADVQAARSASMSGEVAKLRKAAQAVRDLAEETAKDYGKNPLFKSAAALAKSIATEADRLGVAVNSNSLADHIRRSEEEVMGPINTTVALLEKDFGRLYKIMEGKAATVARNPSHESWTGEGIMKACRDFNQVIGNAGKMAPLGADIGGSAAEFNRFFADMNLYARVDCPFAEGAPPQEIKDHVVELLKLVKRAKTLR